MALLLHVSKSNYARWETGESIIPLKHLIHFCNITNYSLDYALALTSIKKKIQEPIQYDCISIGNKIKTLRIRKRLTQKAFAKSINTTQSVISDYENGLTLIQTAFLYDICQKYKISADYLLKIEVLEVV